MRLFYLLIVLLCLTGCSKPPVVSHFFNEYERSRALAQSQAASKLPFAESPHTALSPVLCWARKCRIRSERQKNLNPQFDGYKSDRTFEEVREIYNNSINVPDQETENVITEEEESPLKSDSVFERAVAKQRFQNLSFDLNQSEIKPSSYPELNELATYLSKNQNLRIKIIGHTDNTGDESENMGLSLKRAQAVVNYFVSKGISSNRISAEGMGSSEPVSTQNTLEAHALNRRVEFEIFE